MTIRESKYHFILADYFLKKPIWFVEDNKVTPNIRKLAELPWQQTKGGKWCKLKLTLSNTEFLDCKCEMLGVDTLLTDFVFALNCMPKDVSEREEILIAFVIISRQAHILRSDSQILPQLIYNELAWSSFNDSELWKSVVEYFTKIRNPQLIETREPVGAKETVPVRTIVAPGKKLSSIAVSPDGKILAGACGEIGTCLWETDTGILNRRLRTELSHDMFLAFNLNGTRLLTGGWWSDVWLWDVNSGKLICSFHVGLFIADIIFARGMNSFVIIDERGNVHKIIDDKDPILDVWYKHQTVEVPNDLPKFLIPAFIARQNAQCIIRIAVASDGSFAASGELSGRIGLADMNGLDRGWVFEPKAEEVEVKDIHPDHLIWEGITQIEFSPNTNYLVSTHRSWRWRLWDVCNSEPLFERNAHRASTISLAFHPEGKYFVTGGEDGEINFWNVTDGNKLSSIVGHFGFVVSLKFSPDGNLLYSSCDDGTMKVWVTMSAIKTHGQRGHNKIIYGTRFSPKALLLASWENFYLRIWNVENMQCQKAFEFNGFVLEVIFSADEKFCAVSIKNNGIFIYDTDSWKISHTVNISPREVRCLAFSPDSNYLATGDDYTVVCIWNTRTGLVENQFDPLSSIALSFMGINSLSYSPDGMQIYVATVSPEIFVFSVKDETVKTLSPLSLMGRQEAVYSMHDCSTILTTNASGVYEIINIETGVILRTFGASLNQFKVKDISICPNDRLIAIANGTEKIELWSIENGKQVGVFYCSHTALAVHFHPETYDLFVADNGGSVHIPDVYQLNIIE